ncbi:MAG: MAPEG family protein [Myxococcota bacterium]|jgi:hypothetical protein
MHVSVTLLYGGLTFLLVTLLGLNVSYARGKHKAGFGTMPEVMSREIRAHGNAAEWAPLAIVLLLLLELSGVERLALHALGGTIVLGRVVHGVGALVPKRNPLTTLGALVNYLVTAVLCVWAIARHFA